MFAKLLIICTHICSVVCKLNFLLIVVDDLRTALGCYGDKNAYTPNIDQFAKESVIFSQAFAQQALCAPSRNSILTSRRPDTLQLYDFYSYWRTKVGNYSTLPQHLKNNGYNTMSIGKIFHPGITSNYSDDSPYSWTMQPFHPYTNRYKDAPVCQTTSDSSPARNLICPVQVSSMPNKTLPDIEVLDEARKFIHTHRRDAAPFFLAVGFHKPHIPLKYPQKYLKYHPLRKFKMPKPYSWPNVSSVAYNPWTDLRKREDVEGLLLKFPWQKIPSTFGRSIIQSYYSAVSYIDDMIGMLIKQLSTSGIRDNTVIVLTSDHGWQLGEHAEWAKYSNFDVALHVPLIISIPRLTFKMEKGNMNQLLNKPDNLHLFLKKPLHKKITSNKSINNVTVFETSCTNVPTTRTKKHNKVDSKFVVTYKDCRVTDVLVELVDIFPTVADIAGVPIPMCQHVSQNSATNATKETDELSNLCSEGITLLPYIKALRKCKTVHGKKAAFSQYPRPSVIPTLHPNSDKPRLKDIHVMGYSLKTHNYRYTAWVRFKHRTTKADWRLIIADELYDHTIDPEETVNLANFPHRKRIKEKLRVLLKCGWRCALPLRFTFFRQY